MSEAHEQAEGLIHRNARRDWITVGLVALLVIMVGLNGWLLHDASQRAQAARQNALSLAEQVQRACLDEDVIVSDKNVCDRAEEVVEEPATPVTPQPGPSGAAGERGPGPSENDIAVAVAAYCDSRGDCRGPAGAPGASVKGDKGDPGESVQGEKGDPGASVKGDKGDTGDTGDTGATGDTGQQGEPGRPPTAEEILAQVQAFCAANYECRGPVGDTGMNGQNGTPGPACPDGYVATETVVITATGPTTAVLCQSGTGQ
jgi:hypothetical protein